MGSEGNSISTVCEGGFKWVIRIHCHTAWHGIKDVFGGRWAKLELASYIPPALPDKISSVLGSCLLYGIGEDLLLGCRDIFLPQWSDHTYGTRLCALHDGSRLHICIPRIVYMGGCRIWFLVLRPPESRSGNGNTKLSSVFCQGGGFQWVL